MTQVEKILHQDLIDAEKFAYEPSGLILDKIVREEESSEYGAFELEVNHLRIKFRVAKITPKKTGQFVTIWKRSERGPIVPYDVTDPFDLFIVSVRTSLRFGQFVFPNSILFEKGMLSKEGKGGKRALRVYPPWDKTDNSQAEKTQQWQLPYFFEIDHKSIDVPQVRRLFHKSRGSSVDY